MPGGAEGGWIDRPDKGRGMPEGCRGGAEGVQRGCRGGAEGRAPPVPLSRARAHTHHPGRDLGETRAGLGRDYM